MAKRKMMNKKIITAVCAGMLTLGMALPVMAGVIYVDINNASGNEDGSIEFPYDSIRQAISNAVNGDTIKVAPGVYMGDLDIVSKSLKLEGEDPATTTIQGVDRAVEVAGSFSGGSDPVVISGFTITGGATTGIYLESSTLYAIIKNNIILGNTVGVQTEGQSTQATISNNTVTKNSSDGMKFNWGSYSVNNNIIVNNVGRGLYEYGAIVIASNNNVWANTNGDIVPNGSGISSIDNISFDPQLIADSFYLSAGSPCIDAGRTLSADNDPDGTRNDMGVYGGPSAANFWPEPAGGPVVTSMSVFPPSVPVGGTITLQATGKIR